MSGPLHLTQAVGQGTAHTPLCFAHRDGVKMFAALNILSDTTKSTETIAAPQGSGPPPGIRPR